MLKLDDPVQQTTTASDTATPAFDVRGLTVEFPTIRGNPTVAVRDLDLRIESGEIFGLVGESGAGKTTLARSLLRLPPEPGRTRRRRTAVRWQRHHASD